MKMREIHVKRIRVNQELGVGIFLGHHLLGRVLIETIKEKHKISKHIPES